MIDSRRPRWSAVFTTPIAGRVPAAFRPQVLAAIRGIHTAIFVSVAAAVAVALFDGLRQRPARRTAVAGLAVIGESLAYVSNNQVCPLTPLAEELGAERGSVVDMYLPDWAARRIPVVAGTAAVLAAVLNARALGTKAWSRQSAPTQIGAL